METRQPIISPAIVTIVQRINVTIDRQTFTSIAFIGVIIMIFIYVVVFFLILIITIGFDFMQSECDLRD